MLRLVDTKTTVPDWFVYVFPETGYRVRMVDYGDWLRAIKQHYKDNELTMPDDWIAIAEDQLCRSLPPGNCMYEDGSAPNTFVNRRIDVHDVLRGTKVLLAFVTQGMPLVDQETAEARAKTCANCFLNIDIPGCSPCVGLQNLAHEVAGAKQTKADQYLKSCAICHCVNRAQIWVPIEVLKKGVTPEQQEQFKSVPFCWKGKELTI